MRLARAYSAASDARPEMQGRRHVDFGRRYARRRAEPGDNNDAPKLSGIWHSITACKAPCDKETGIAYPLADANVQFDSGQLGVAGPPTAGTITWQTLADLPTGTYTYFCRIHPFMRGAFEVTPASS